MNFIEISETKRINKDDSAFPTITKLNIVFFIIGG